MAFQKIIIFIVMFQNYSCKTAVANYNNDEKVEIHYIEIYESICCPRDYKHDNNLINYIGLFEEKYNIRLSNNFKLPLGKEGEVAYFLSLSSLSEELQEEFVNGRREEVKIDDKSVISHLKKPITIKQALQPWGNKSITNLIKF